MNFQITKRNTGDRKSVPDLIRGLTKKLIGDIGFFINVLSEVFAYNSQEKKPSIYPKDIPSLVKT